MAKTLIKQDVLVSREAKFLNNVLFTSSCNVHEFTFRGYFKDARQKWWKKSNICLCSPISSQLES